MDPEDTSGQTVYPQQKIEDIPLGLPDNINRAFLAAAKVKTIDANAYAVLIGRVIEMVGEDRNATGRSLADLLQDLASKNEIPDKLVHVAKYLRDFRNIGAHATLGDLANEEVPILTDLCTAVLEYVYTAPFLATQAEQAVNKLKAKKGLRKSSKK